MNEKALKTLEFNKIVEKLVEHATSDPGRILCKELRPSVVRKTIEESQEETAAAVTRILKKGNISFGSNRNFTDSLRGLEIGATLSQIELLRLAQFLENVARIKAFGRNERTGEEEQEDCLSPSFDALEPLTNLSKEIRRCILSEEEMADDASTTLRQIRREIRVTGDKIHTQLGSLLNGSYRSYLQDAVITQRNDRYCIPVKAEYKGQVPGMIHDQSASGSTFFIEPTAIVVLNNKLKELSVQEQEEIERILSVLSAEAGEHVFEIKEDSKIMARLDFIFAKAKLALDMNGSRPLFREDGILHIRKGRHPLIPAKQVVPIDIRLGEDFDLLVITGPNTGGKTVSLKTVGLFTLMGQAGLHIPAGDRSELSVFREIFADIGDEQSIELSLSTFSSHMTNIVQILKQADEHSLCLFDELCSGTDPTEGAALAIAILDYLHGRGIRSIASTHYSELKVYALSTSFVENACCEFDVESLRPTYRLLIGIPGKSNAFAISSKLGLSGTIIDSARKQISAETESFEDLLADLEKSRTTIEKEEAEIASYKREAEALKKKLEEKQEKLETAKEKILREANEQAREILQEAKDYADWTIKTLQKTGGSASIKEMEMLRQGVREEIGKKNSKLSIQQEPEKKGGGLKPSDLHLGDSVKIVSMGLKGTVNSLPDQKGNLFVQCGIMRTKTNINDLVPIEEATVTGPGDFKLQKSGSGKIKMNKSLSVSTEINLLGKTVDEALYALDKYLDDAYLAHLPSVRIVHGKGTGALRQAVTNHLRKVKYVESFRLGEFGEGDAGVTIAVFRN